MGFFFTAVRFFILKLNTLFENRKFKSSSDFSQTFEIIVIVRKYALLFLTVLFIKTFLKICSGLHIHSVFCSTYNYRLL